MKVEWDKIWPEFDKYCDRYGVFDWEKQRRKIENLVNKNLKDQEVV